MVNGKLDTGSKGGLIHNTWYWLVTLNLVVSLNLMVTFNLLVTLNLVVTLTLMAPESNLPKLDTRWHPTQIFPNWPPDGTKLKFAQTGQGGQDWQDGPVEENCYP